MPYDAGIKQILLIEEISPQRLQNAVNLKLAEFNQAGFNVIKVDVQTYVSSYGHTQTIANNTNNKITYLATIIYSDLSNIFNESFISK